MVFLVAIALYGILEFCSLLIFDYNMVLVFYYLLFGRPENKRTILNKIGLDLTEEKFLKMKEHEFKNRCLRAMYCFFDQKIDYQNDEDDFLKKILAFLSDAAYGELGNTHKRFGICREYFGFAVDVLDRRLDSITEDPGKKWIDVNLRNKKWAKLYFSDMWRLHSKPFPENWLEYGYDMDNNSYEDYDMDDYSYENYDMDEHIYDYYDRDDNPYDY